MNRVARFLVDLVSKDPWRKLGAIVLAVGLWFYVHQRITGETVRVFEVRPTNSKSWESETGILYVHVPKDRVLKPAKLTIKLRGVNQELDRLPPQLRAFYDPGEGEFQPTARVFLKAVRWDPLDLAGLIHEPESFTINFEPIQKYNLALRSEQLELRGSPPEGTQMQREQILFTPSAATLKGPQSAIERLKKNGFTSVFTTVAISKTDTQNPQVFSLELHPDLVRDGISFEGTSPFARIPIRPAMKTLPFKARIYPIASGDKAQSRLENYHLDGSSDTNDWVEESWEAVFPATLESEITEAWIQKNVRFYVDLGEVSENVDQESIEVFSRLKIENPDQARFEGLSFRPKEVSKTKMVVEKKKKKP